MAPPHLPNEIFLSIISLLPSSDHATLHACQLTSRAFREYSTPVLYGHLDISWTAKKGLALLYSLFDHSSLADLIISVKVVIPHVEDLVSRHRAVMISKIREAEEREWPARLGRMDPAELVEDWETYWSNELDNDLDERDRDLWRVAEEDVHFDLVRSGNAQWHDPPSFTNARFYDRPYLIRRFPVWYNGAQHHYEGRRVGVERLGDLLTSLPNLRRLDLSPFDSFGIPALPRLTFLALEYKGEYLSPEWLPIPPNIEELVLKGRFLPPSESATAPRLPKLHTLRIQSPSNYSLKPLVTELLDLLKSTLKTLEVTIEFTWGRETVVELLAPSLCAIPGLQTLHIPRPRLESESRILSIEQSPLFLSYLASSSLRDVDLPLLPSPLLFASLPASIERVNLSERVADSELMSAIDGLLLERARLPHLALVAMSLSGGAAEEWEERVQERVQQGRLLGVEIGLR